MTEAASTSRNLVIEMSGVSGGSMRDPEATVTNDVNWSVAAGDFWVIAGLQGSGKDEFLMMTAGLFPPSRGTLRLFGDELQRFEDRQMQQRLKLGYVFENGHLLHTLTVAENIALPLRYHRDLTAEELARRTNRLLELTELTSFANSTSGTLGRNWRKRTGLARALAAQPELLLVESPLSGIDSRHVEWWLNFLGELSHGHDWMPDKRPTTLVVTTDDAHRWQGVARQFAVFRDGRLEIEQQR